MKQENMNFESKIEKVLHGKKRIVVYGAGNIGKQCKDYICKSDKYTFVAWVDKYKAGEIVNEYKLIGISDIHVLEYDCILIAIDHIKIKRDVQKELISNKIEKIKIVQWLCDLEMMETGEFQFECTKNNKEDIYHKIQILNSNNLQIGDVLKKLGVKKVYIYGSDEIAEILYEQIHVQIQVEDDVKLDVPIIIAHTSDVAKTIYDMMQRGIKRELLWSLNSLLSICVEAAKPTARSMNLKRQFLITGAQFENKGAQAMLYITIHEIRTRYPDAIIWYLPCNGNELYSEELQQKYDMIFLLDGNDIDAQVFEVVSMLFAIVDVSGYALSASWYCENYIRIIRMAYYYDVPLFLMPQSYGELDFIEDVQVEIKKALQAARVVYAREEKGFYAMKETFQLDNIRLSKDLVLQSKGVVLENIYSKDIVLPTYEIEQKETIAIVPNVRCYEWGNKQEILRVYKEIVEHLLENKKSIYIISHSDDREICSDIYELFIGNPNVYLYQKEFDCIGYSQLIRNFQYVIGSRYHALVHALKESVPCISIGWADKYIELMNAFHQTDYVFDVRDKIDVGKILSAVRKMERCFKEESKIISSILPEFQKENCFDVLSNRK